MNFFEWLLTPFSSTPALEIKERVWDTETVTMQQPVSPENPNPEVIHDATEVGLRGGGEGSEVCCGVCCGLLCFECCCGGDD
ncbi:uncharacterized protein BO80DRAFT_466684 [Aspergillus ibericus CBS 121593]|uniref:Cysteine-rich transmembrane CYSTM domain-containing protein n=1 Tax=Aspergillus ibericus CBS 121593 TaxID=1448316 RepID=A0A395GXC3_9EURO|nr:hypothetical protein BO80DRAFT_466684 [Aspergillus ibericus CBS 121593]RAK98703.1 hypothetical protein BO80DRAFT_466684 [Aspergillus ibericus CBS 121593]